MSAIGETLRRERVRQGLDLQALSQTTKIGTRMLGAIETGDYAKLPGGVLTRNFIKQYAIALGVDPASFESELSDFRPKLDEIPRNTQPSFLPNEPRSSGPVVAIAAWVLLAGLACGGIYYLLKPKEIPKAVQQIAPEPSNPEPVKKAEAPPVAAILSSAVQVVISASEASWVSITVDGKMKFTGILQPDDHQNFNADEKVRVVTGNAGGLDIRLNGKKIDPLGTKGQRRTVDLTPAGAQMVSRVPNAEPLF